MAKDVREIGVELNFGVFKMNTKWTPTKEERKAAWELYIELITRISVFSLEQNEGSDREALSSLYELFQSTRKVLKSYGPGIAIGDEKSGTFSVAHLAIAFLNYGLRPFMAKWHPILVDYEANLSKDGSRIKHEREWTGHVEFRVELETLQHEMVRYSDCLADGAGVPRIYEEQENIIKSKVL